MDDQPEALRLANRLESDFIRSQTMLDAAAELRRLAGIEAERDALLALIADDAFAASFQSLAQYRSALLKATRKEAEMTDPLRDLLARIVSRERHRGTVLLDAEDLCAIETALAQAKPCDMGQMCLNCQPKGPNGECPDKLAEPVKLWPLAPLTGYYDIGGKRVWLEKDDPFPAPPQQAKPVQEPVAHKHEWFSTGAMEPGQMRCIHCGIWNNEATPQQAEPVQEPVQFDPAEAMRLADEYADLAADVRAKQGYPDHAVAHDRKLRDEARAALEAYLSRQAEPVTRKPLTEEEIHSIAAQVARQDGKWIFLFTRALEAAHGIKEKA